MINPWLERLIKLSKADSEDPVVQLIVQVQEGREQEVAAALRRMGVRVVDVAGPFLLVSARPSQAYDIARVPGVVSVSYNAPMWTMDLATGEYLKRVALRSDPLLSRLSREQLAELGIELAERPLGTGKFEVRRCGAVLVYNVEGCATVATTRQVLRAPPLSQAELGRTKVGVIDTGVPPLHPAFRKGPFLEVSFVPEPPTDTMGHGTWCSTAAWGDPAPTAFGNFEPVARAPGQLFAMAKVFMAFGSTTDFLVIKAMDFLARWGARVVSMSLGGPLQGSVDQDPASAAVAQYHRKYGTIFVVAAGNSGPQEWTIASPGASPYALTVGSVSYLDPSHVASYSSRGPNGAWYQGNRDAWEADYEKYGDLIVKPDVTSPGGTVEYQVVAGVTPWYDGLYELAPPSGFDLMTGTSMATPQVAALVSLALDRGLASSLTELKERLRATSQGRKSVDSGWGLALWPRLAYGTY